MPNSNGSTFTCREHTRCMQGKKHPLYFNLFQDVHKEMYFVSKLVQWWNLDWYRCVYGRYQRARGKIKILCVSVKENGTEDVHRIIRIKILSKKDLVCMN